MQIKKVVLKKLEKFINIAQPVAITHPELVIISFHEYFRNLYKYDSFIKKRRSHDPLKNISIVLDDCIDFLFLGKKFGFYSRDSKTSIKKNLKVNKFKLYGQLWEERKNYNLIDSTQKLKGIFKRSNKSLKLFQNKNVIDIGCGSGRFSVAFSKLGAKKVYAVDRGEHGISIAKKFAKNNKISNVSYIKSSVLNLPFKNEKFDFVFSKGVLHHTGSLLKGLNEFYRVMKKNGSGFLYLYGSGGIYWNSRKKMRKVMKNIPYKYTHNVLKSLGLPAKRYIFLDSWYVDIEEHVDQNFLENWFKKKKLKFFKYKKNALPYELESAESHKHFKFLYGSGELRYFVKKLAKSN